MANTRPTPEFLSDEQWIELRLLPIQEQIVAVHGMCLLLGEEKKYEFSSTPGYKAWITTNQNAVTMYNNSLGPRS